MMRMLFIAALLAGCGDLPPPPPLTCSDYAGELAMTVRNNGRCINDTQCRWIDDACLLNCATFVDGNGVDPAEAIVRDAKAAGCTNGCSCTAVRPVCNNGRCGGVTL